MRSAQENPNVAALTQNCGFLSNLMRIYLHEDVAYAGRFVSKGLSDVSEHQASRVLRKHGIHLQRRRTWCIRTGLQSAKKATDIVGLHLSPPENAVVISVDEKPVIQTVQAAQEYLRLPTAKAMTGYNHQYRCH